MTCPYCNAAGNSQIQKTSPRAGYVARRRKCLSCKKRFSTRETVTEVTQVKLLEEGHRNATKGMRVIRNDLAVLWQNDAMIIGLCRRILRAQGADDSLAAELDALFKTARSGRP